MTPNNGHLSAPAPPPHTAVTLARQPRDIKDLIKSADFENAVKAGLPKHLKVERFMRVALNATMRQPDLMRCSKESFFLRMLELSALGIEPDGRRAHLIPFQNNKMCGVCSHAKDRHKNGACQVKGCTSKGCGHVPSLMEVTLIIDYKGLAELIRRSGDVSYMHADAIYSKDEFDFKYGSGAFLVHKPNMSLEERGHVVGFYSFVKLRDGNEDFIVMSKSDVDKIRKRSKASESGPWSTDYDEMGKKTVFRRHSKWLPLSPESRDAVEADDDALDIEGAYTVSADNAMIGEETADEHDARLKSQMEEQARELEAGGEAEASYGGPFNPPTQGIMASSAGTPQGPWQDRAAMLADFREQSRGVTEEEFVRILGGNGIDSDEGLVTNSPETIKAFNELKAAVAAKAKQEAPEQRSAPAAEKPVFGSRGRNRQ